MTIRTLKAMDEAEAVLKTMNTSLRDVRKLLTVIGARISVAHPRMKDLPVEWHALHTAEMVLEQWSKMHAQAQQADTVAKRLDAAIAPLEQAVEKVMGVRV